ncbi:hypothetical protein QEN19_003772 [Hanseniaspora menglaensis]
MDNLTDELNNVNSKYQISSKVHDSGIKQNFIDNPLPLSLKLLDNSSIGLNSKLNEYLRDNENLNLILKDYVGANYKYILNDNMSTYLKIYKEYTTKNNVDYANSIDGKEISNSSLKNLKVLNENFIYSSRQIQLISLIEYIINEQNYIMGLLFNTKSVNIKLVQYNYIIKSYKKLDNLISINKIYLFYDISIVNNNKKIKERLKNNLFDYLVDLIFKPENSFTSNAFIRNDSRSIKEDLKYIIKLFDLLNSCNNETSGSDNSRQEIAYEFIIQNLELIIAKKFEEILVNEVNHLREDNPYKYESIKKHKFKSIRDLLSSVEDLDHDLMRETVTSLASQKNLSLDQFKNNKTAEIEMILYDFFSDFFNTLNSKIVYLLLLVDLLDKSSIVKNSAYAINGKGKVVKIIENYLLKLLKLYLIPSLNSVSAIKQNKNLQEITSQTLFSINKNSILADDFTETISKDREETEYEKLQQLFEQVLPGVAPKKDKSQEQKEKITTKISKNDLLLIIPSNLFNLKYILPNLTSIMKSLSKFNLQNSSNFLTTFLNDFYINELFTNNINYILNTKIYNINLTHGDSFFKLNSIIETFLSIINNLFNVFPGIEYQFNESLMNNIYEIFLKFLNHVESSFRNFIKMFVNLNSIPKIGSSSFAEVIKVANYMKGSNEFATINEKFVINFLQTYKGLTKLDTWFKETLFSNINLINEIQVFEQKDDNIDFEDLKEMWLLNDQKYEYSQMNKNGYTDSIEGILISTKLNNLLHELIYSKFDNDFINGIFKEKMLLFTLFELNKLVMSLEISSDIKSNDLEEKFEYLYLREDNHTDSNINAINNILSSLSHTECRNNDIDVNEYFNFIVLNHFMDLSSFDRIAYILYNLKKIDKKVDLTESINFFSLHELNVNDIIEFSNDNKGLYSSAAIKHMIKLRLVYESGNNKSILQKRLDESYKKLK